MSIDEHGLWLFLNVYKKDGDKVELAGENIEFHTNDFLLKIVDSADKEYFNSDTIFKEVPVEKPVEPPVVEEVKEETPEEVKEDRTEEETKEG